MINWYERILSPKVEIPQPNFYMVQGFILV